MTAATAQRQAKAGQGGQQQQSVLTPGHTLMVEGVQIELDLNPGGKSAGVGGHAEWIVRMGWLGGAPNPLSASSSQGSTKGIIVEVEYVPLLSMPHDKSQQSPLDVPVILSSFLSSLLPLQQASPPPQVTVLTSSPQEWESIGVNAQNSECFARPDGANQEVANATGSAGTRWDRDERVRRATWTLVKHLKSIGMIA
ncbi:hypothetical protein NCC49_004389 [Naganishia albida]|nr:hypothetical protein NCC49_004389 [Naganishia albida]